MPTIGSILSNASTGLRAQQDALSVVSHNISNAAAEGYTQQRAVLSANPALRTAVGTFGTGVRVTDVVQIRDSLLDASYRTEAGMASEHETRAGILGRVETLLGEPSDQALSGVLDRFLSAWSDLAANPTSATGRTVVRQRGQELADKMSSLAVGIDAIRQDVEARVSQAVDRVNALTGEIARLNREIVSVESSGSTAGDLRDARARALDELATLIPLRTTERSNGAVGIECSGYNVVDGAYAASVEAVSTGAGVELRVAGRARSLTESGGSLGGLLAVLNRDLPEVLSALDELARELVVEVNAIHRTGTNASGATGVDFFDPAGNTAWTLSLSAEVSATADAVSAGTGDADGRYRAGANDVAMALAALRDSGLGTLGSSPGEHLRGLVSSLGLAVRSCTDTADVHRTLADQADVRRQSLGSVSVDEELVRLIQYQSAYRAAAKVVSAADELLQSLLSI